MGVKFRDGEKEFKALVISPSALSALSRKEGSAQWELLRASQLTWLVQRAALMNDTLSWKWRGKTSFLLETQATPKASTAVPTGGSPSPGELLWGGRARQPRQGGDPLFGAHPGTGWGLVAGGPSRGGRRYRDPRGCCRASESGARFIGDRLMSNNWVTMAKSIPKILFCFPENCLPIIVSPSESCHSAITQILTNSVVILSSANVNKADCYTQTPRINQGK